MMTTLHALAGKARRRLAAVAMLRAAGLGAAVGAGVGLALTVAGAMLGWATPWWIVLASPVLAGVMTGAGWAWMTRPAELAAAARLDAALALKDRVATGLSATLGDEAFADVARADASALVGRVDVRRAFPMRWGRAWGVALGLAALGVIAGVMIPRLGWTAGPTAAQQAAAERAKLEAVRSIDEAVEVAKASPVVTAEARADQLAVLEDLRAEIERGVLDPATGTRQAAKKLSEIADAAERAESKLAAEAAALRERLQRSLASNTAQERRDQEEATDLRQALASGDPAAAEKAAQGLLSSRESVTPEQRARYAQELDELSKALEQQERPGAASTAASSDAPKDVQAAPPAVGDDDSTSIERAMTEQGLSPEHAADLARQADPATVQRELERAGVSPEAAKTLAEQAAEARRERDAAEEARRQTRELADAAREAAQELRGESAQKPAAENSSQPNATGNDRPRTPGNVNPPSAQGADDPKPRPDAKPDDGKSPDRARQTDESNRVQTNAKPAATEQSDQRSEARRNGDASSEAKSEPSNTPGDRGSPAQAGDKSKSAAQSKSEPSQPSEAKSETGEQGKSERAANPDESTTSHPEPNGSGKPSGAAPPSGAPSEAAVKPEPGANSQADAKQPSGAKSEPGNQPRAQETSSSTRKGEPTQSVEKPSAPGTTSESGAKSAPGTESATERERPSAQNASKQTTSSPTSPSVAEPDASTPPQPRSSQQGSRQPGKTPSPDIDSNKQSESRESAKMVDRDDPKADQKQSGAKNEQGHERVAPEKIDTPNKQPGEGGAPPDLSALKRFAEKYRELAKKSADSRQGGGDDQAEPMSPGDAAKLREQARKLAERMTPEQKRELAQWAREMAKRGEGDGAASASEDARHTPGSQPGRAPMPPVEPREAARFDPVDARPKPSDRDPTDTTRQRVAAEWLAPARAGTSTAPMSRDGVVREAQRGAERAIEDRAVPARFDKLLQRYFKRLPETAEGTSPAQPAATPAKDAQ